MLRLTKLQVSYVVQALDALHERVTTDHKDEISGILAMLADSQKPLTWGEMVDDALVAVEVLSKATNADLGSANDTRIRAAYLLLEDLR